MIVKGRKEFVGKTIVLSRNRINFLLTQNCTLSGLGVFRVSYSVSWSGNAEHARIEELLSQKRVDPRGFASMDMELCSLLKAQDKWKYTIVDLENITDFSDILLG